MMPVIRILVILSMAVAGACATVNRHDVLSAGELDSLLASIGVHTPWHVEKEQEEDDGDFDWFVFVYERTKNIQPLACAMQVHGLGVRGTDAEIVRHQTEWKMAFRACEGLGLEDFFPLVPDLMEEDLPEMAELVLAAIPAFGGSPARVSFQADDLSPIFGRATREGVMSVAQFDKTDMVLSFYVPELTPDMLGVRVSRDMDGALDFVYRENGPYVLE